MRSRLEGWPGPHGSRRALSRPPHHEDENEDSGSSANADVRNDTPCSPHPLAAFQPPALARVGLPRQFQPLGAEQLARGVGAHRLAEDEALRVFAAELVELDR